MRAIAESIGLVAVLLALAVGAGSWLWLLTGRPALARGHTWIWLVLAGFGLGGLVLQSLLYCNVTLRVAAWPGLALALGGVGTAWRVARRQGLRGGPGLAAEMRLSLLVFGLALLGQSPSLVNVGPARFYGAGGYDQANYVAVADSLIDVPFSSRWEDIGYRPWLVPAWIPREERITPLVLLGTGTVILRSSSQENYAVMSLFLIALAGVAVTNCLRAAGLSRFAAGCAGVAAALSPALAQIYVDGYFSQLSSLFVLPALAGVLGGKGPLRREAKVIAGVLLAYLLGAYSEIAVFGFALAGLLLILKRETWGGLGRDLLLVGSLSLLLNPGYFSRLLSFLLLQWNYAQDTGKFASLFPDSGTLTGWSRLFAGATWPGLAQAAGVAVIGLAVAGAWRLARLRRYGLPAAITMAAVALLLLRLRPQFPSYVFSKLSIEFAPLWIAAAMAGLMLGFRRARPWRRLAAGTVALLGLAASWAGAWPHHLRVMNPTGVLAGLSSERMLAFRREIEGHPERVYLMAHDEPLTAQWLCYFARRSLVVVDRRTVGGRLLATETYACRRWNGPTENLHWLDPGKSGLVPAYEPPPHAVVRGAGETGGENREKYYAATPELEIVLTRPPGLPPRQVWLDFATMPVGAGPSARLELTDASGRRRVAGAGRPGWHRWPLLVPAGESVCRLRVVADQNPAVLIKFVSVETTATLPAWQSVPEAQLLPAGAAP